MNKCVAFYCNSQSLRQHGGIHIAVAYATQIVPVFTGMALKSIFKEEGYLTLMHVNEHEDMFPLKR